jgi:DNA repair ATPase RecN
LKAERETIKLERKNLYDEQRNIIRDLNDSKKTGKLAINQYSGTMKEKFNTENQLRKEIRALDDVKKRVSSDLDALQYRFNELRKPSTSESFSLEDLHQKIQLKEHQLTTGDINKR